MHLDIDGIRLFYETHGQGRPLLTMHGGLGFDHTTLRPWLDPLGDQATLVYYDHRGNGASDAPTDWSAVDHGTFAGDADALRAHLGHDRMVLFGHSYGSFLALEYAVRHPERLDGLILCGTAGALDYQEAMIGKAQARATPEQFQTLMAGLSAPAADDAAYGTLFRAIAPLYFHDPAHPAVARMADGITYRAGSFNRGMFELLPQYDVRPRLGALEVPTLVVNGDDDWITPLELGARPVAEAIPGARLEVIAGAGHFPFVERPDATLAVIRDFLGGLA